MPSFSIQVETRARPKVTDLGDRETPGEPPGPPGKALRLHGRLTVDEAEALWDAIRSETDSLGRGSCATIDLSRLDHADGAAIAVLLELQTGLEARGVATELLGAKRSVAELLRVYGRRDALARGDDRRGATRFLARVGRRAVASLREIQVWLAFVGSLAVALGAVVRRPGTANWKDVAALMDRTGASAVPIVLVINFLIGIITAYQFGVALKQFGATSYVPGFVCLAITRELGPLMTAIIVTGRSGAAVSAELGSMAVSDEIDALRALHLDPLRFLVIPRITAFVLTMPLLTLLGDALGMLGGLTVAAISLDMSATEYFVGARTGVFAHDISFGVGKSLIFAMTIGMIACQKGLSTSGGASDVGRRTTSSVVSILFALVAIDAAFAPRS